MKQSALALEPKDITKEQILLQDNARNSLVTYTPQFLTDAEADALLTTLMVDTPFQTETPVVFGRAIEVRRRSYAYGDPNTRYHYSGLERIAAPWHPALLPVIDRLSKQFGVHFNFALCNLYPDGAAGLGWHADDEHELASQAPIASLSLGAERDFQMRLSRRGPTVLSVTLGHGSLLTMQGATQEHYQHQVPKRVRSLSPRLNLTFRVIRTLSENNKSRQSPKNPLS